jgi:D-3-phosphoglycerate dehydrogenase
MGFLRPAVGKEVNMVNALDKAASLGLKVNESRMSVPGDFTDLIEVSAGLDGDSVSVAGTFFGATPRIVRINDKHVEARPSGVLFVLENQDRPGIVGLVGTMLGEHKVNIAGMSLSRNEAGGTALTVLNLDTAPDASLIAKLLAIGDIKSARVIEL